MVPPLCLDLQLGCLLTSTRCRRTLKNSEVQIVVSDALSHRKSDPILSNEAFSKNKHIILQIL